MKMVAMALRNMETDRMFKVLPESAKVPPKMMTAVSTGNRRITTTMGRMIMLM